MESDGELREMFMESDKDEDNFIDNFIDDEEMEAERKADKRKRDTINRSGMSSEVPGRGADHKRTRDDHDRGGGGNQDANEDGMATGDGVAAGMNSSWNYIPTPDVSIQSDNATRNSSAMDSICKSERRILSMVLLGVAMHLLVDTARIQEVHTEG